MRPEKRTVQYTFETPQQGGEPEKLLRQVAVERLLRLCRSRKERA